MRPADILPDGYYADDWKPDAACRGDDRFIREPDDGLRVELADICAGCSVLAECGSDVEEWQPVEVFQAGVWRD